jgi:hypothetical protein
MRSSQVISLFSERPEVSQRSSSFLASIVVHGAALGVVFFGLAYLPEIHERKLSERYSIRHLDLTVPDLKGLQTAGSGIAYPGPRADQPKASPGGSEASMRQIAEAEPGPQTLIQPDLPKPVKLKEETPVPTVEIWTPKKETVQALVAPLPAKPTAAEVHPAPDPPNEEVNLADLSVAANSMAAQTHPILPSTTSPVVVHGPELAQLPPATTSESKLQPTPTAVMSLSDLRMKSGTVTLPPVNETAAKSSPGTLTAGAPGNPLQAGNGGHGSSATGARSGQGGNDPGDPKGGAGKSDGTKSGSGQGAKAGVGSGNAGQSGSTIGSGDQGSTTHIALPKDGHYDAVVVGASLEEKYPETANVWTGRMVYTVYLHVGTAKAWILQYSLKRDGDAAVSGNIIHLEAPWPYNIVRPNLTADAINADALMVHGFVNQGGLFELLAVSFPPEFPEKQFVLDALRQWQFRPASQDGHVASVEVLLIIPEQPE